MVFGAYDSYPNFTLAFHFFRDARRNTNTPSLHGGKAVSNAAHEQGVVRIGKESVKKYTRKEK